MVDTQFSLNRCLFICLHNTSVDSYIEDDFFYKIFLEFIFSGEIMMYVPTLYSRSILNLTFWPKLVHF